MIKLIKKLGTDDINQWREAEPLNNSGYKPTIYNDNDDSDQLKGYRKDLC